MDFLRKIRKIKELTLSKMAAVCVGINHQTISAIEIDKQYLGTERAKIIGDALGIPEDVMTVYRGHLPGYAKKTYREKPDKLEKAIRKSVKKIEKEEQE